MSETVQLVRNRRRNLCFLCHALAVILARELPARFVPTLRPIAVECGASEARPRMHMSVMTATSEVARDMLPVLIGGARCVGEATGDLASSGGASNEARDDEFLLPAVFHRGSSAATAGPHRRQTSRGWITRFTSNKPTPSSYHGLSLSLFAQGLGAILGQCFPWK